MMLADAVRVSADTQGLTHQQLANDAGVSAKHLSRMLCGRAGGSFEIWEALLKRLGIKVGWSWWDVHTPPVVRQRKRSNR
jgi:transcriptional regulator with XRE-family HTH domain